MSLSPGWTLAFDVGGTFTKLACISSAGEIHGWRSIPTTAPRERYLAAFGVAVRALVADAPGPLSEVAGAVAGFLDDEGFLVLNPNLAWLEGVNLRAVLSSLLALPLHLENDANAACAGEFYFGTGRGSRRFLCLTAGTGVGVGMMVDGRLLRPAWGGLGDAGHIVISPGGPPCPCGGLGCAEAVLSIGALASHFGASAGAPRSFRDLVEAAAVDDPLARATVAAAGQHLGVALASLAQIFYPERIAIAGGVSLLGEPLLVAARASFAAHVGRLAAAAQIVPAVAGANATLVGAVAGMLLARGQRPAA